MGPGMMEWATGMMEWATGMMERVVGNDGTAAAAVWASAGRLWYDGPVARRAP